MEFEAVADYDPDLVKKLQRMSQHDYLLHILALKKRSERLEKLDKEDF